MAFQDIEYKLDTSMPAFLFLMRYLNISQAEAQKLISMRRLRVNGEICMQSGKKIEGKITVQQFIPVTQGLTPLFTTPDFGVFDKPSGLLVHPKTHKTPYSLLDDIRYVYGKNANNIHRIDMETSGLVLVSRSKEAEKRLKKMFELRLVKKSYLVWARGRLDRPFDVDAPLLKNSDYDKIKLKMVVHSDGKPSFTHFIPLRYERKIDATLLKAIPLTGRQHQIRVHLFHVKHPVLGDPIYGVPFEVAMKYLNGEIDENERLYYMGASRLMLHSNMLEFEYGKIKYSLVSKRDFLKEVKKIAPIEKRFLFDE